jgi:oligoribonuclease NrnB/cAMP/cGMP phosphodiesterase (DHH superfamily)
MQRNLIFHGGCPDGFGAAWSARRAWGSDAHYLPRSHDDDFEPERFRDQLVVIADISLPNDLLRELGELAAELSLLDHHLTARDHFLSDPGVENALTARGHQVLFDLGHSGAILAWQYFHPDEDPPDLLRYVEDQDLWNWSLPRSDEVNAAIGSYPRSFECWDELAARPIQSLADEGRPIVRANRIEVERAVKHAHPVAIGNERIAAVNARQPRAAIGHELANRAQYGKAWGIVYRTVGTRVDCTIYSLDDLDASAIATRFGGGGHRNAAGFSVSLEQWLRDFA